MNTPKANWQTKARGTNNEEYAIYRECEDDGTGRSIIDGTKLKTFDEWMAA